jgi:hypothetical protein
MEVGERGRDLAVNGVERLLTILKRVKFSLRRATALGVEDVSPDRVMGGADLLGSRDREVHKDIQGLQVAGIVN